MIAIVIPVVILLSVILIVLSAKQAYEQARLEQAEHLEKIASLKIEMKAKIAVIRSQLPGVSDQEFRERLTSLLDALENK